MDKGYDSEAIHRLIREDRHANSIIPIRSWKNEILGGTYHQEMAHQFNTIVYPRRQLVPKQILCPEKKVQRRSQGKKVPNPDEGNRRKK